MRCAVVRTGVWGATTITIAATISIITTTSTITTTTNTNTTVIMMIIIPPAWRRGRLNGSSDLKVLGSGECERAGGAVEGDADKPTQSSNRRLVLDHRGREDRREAGEVEVAPCVDCAHSGARQHQFDWVPTVPVCCFTRLVDRGAILQAIDVRVAMRERTTPVADQQFVVADPNGRALLVDVNASQQDLGPWARRLKQPKQAGRERRAGTSLCTCLHTHNIHKRQVHFQSLD